ncbi:MAG: glycosyltransferase family 4 protein [Gemmatimonadota bacterium]
MKIVFHCLYYPPEVGGLESHVHQLGRELVTQGHEVHAVTSRSLPGAARKETLDGVQVVRTFFPGRNPLGWILHAVGSIPALYRAAEGAHILHAQAFQSVPPCLLVGRLRKIPVLATFHTSHFLRLAQRRGWRTVLGSLVRRPRYALAASTEIAQVAQELAPGKKVEALTNGVDTQLFQPDGEAGKGARPVDLPNREGRRIILPRRLFPKNGVEYFVRAVPHLETLVGPVQVCLVGDGPQRGELQELARSLGVEARLHFLGAHPHGDMPGLLRWAEVAVFPSLMEATSVAALEAMSTGVPVAASRVGGLPEIVDEDVGALFPPADPQGLAQAVAGLLHRNDLPAVGARARERVVARWSNRRLALRHLEIYQDALRTEVS